MPYEVINKEIDFKQYIELVEEHLKGRKKTGALESEADFLTGAMSMFVFLEQFPPAHWVFDIMSGKSVLDREEKEQPLHEGHDYQPTHDH